MNHDRAEVRVQTGRSAFEQYAVARTRVIGASLAVSHMARKLSPKTHKDGTVSLEWDGRSFVERTEYFLVADVVYVRELKPRV